MASKWMSWIVFVAICFGAAAAGGLVWLERHGHDVRLPLGLSFIQLRLNAAWSPIFFGLQKPGLALVEILILSPAIVLTAMSFFGCSRPAFSMMTPYVGWVGWATHLTVGLWRLNRGAA